MPLERGRSPPENATVAQDVGAREVTRAVTDAEGQQLSDLIDVAQPWERRAENVLAALRAGADGFLSKGASPAELVNGITRVARGEHALSGTAVNAVVDHLADTPRISVDPDAAQMLSQLTAREREIVSYLVSGLTNREIAEVLFLSPSRSRRMSTTRWRSSASGTGLSSSPSRYAPASCPDGAEGPQRSASRSVSSAARVSGSAKSGACLDTSRSEKPSAILF